MIEKQINAVCHRDYFEKRCHVVVEVFADRGAKPSQNKLSQTIGALRSKNLKSLSKNAGEFRSIFGVNMGEFRSIFGVNMGEFRSIFGVHILRTVCLIYNNPKITAKEIADKLSVTKRTVENYLSKLKKANHIVRVGSDKTGYWKVIKK